MNATNTRPHPLVLVALAASHSSVLTGLAQRYPSCRVRLDEADVISADSLAANQVLQRLLHKAKVMGGRLHLIGLLSDGGVHSSLAHLHALLAAAKRARVRVVVHALLDGVDVPAHTASRYLAALEVALEGGVGRIGTVSGRAFGMDCDAGWDRVEKVYRAITADGVERVASALRGVEAACAFGNPEGFVKPFIAFDYPGVSLVDSALHFNFGSEGARKLSHALAGSSFQGFARKGARAPFEGRYGSMTPCDNTLGLPTLFARAPDPSSLPLEALSSVRDKFHCSEGAAPAIAQATTDAIQSRRYDFVLADFANPDAKERTSSAAELEAAVAAISDASRAVGGAIVVTGSRDATNTFPLVYIDDTAPTAKLRDVGQGVDLAATLLDLLQVPQPQDVEGVTLLIR